MATINDYTLDKKIARDWGEGFGIKPINVLCPMCRKERRANIPFLTESHIGFISTEHGCGEDFMVGVAMEKSEGERNWRRYRFLFVLEWFEL